MLSGTAIGIFFASAPTNHLSIRKFWTAFSNIFQGKYYNTTQCFFCWCRENTCTYLVGPFCSREWFGLKTFLLDGKFLKIDKYIQDNSIYLLCRQQIPCIFLWWGDGRGGNRRTLIAAAKAWSYCHGERNASLLQWWMSSIPLKRICAILYWTVYCGSWVLHGTNIHSLPCL